MTDIVERLRETAVFGQVVPVCTEAADEIEAMRKERLEYHAVNAELESEVERLRQHNAELLAALEELSKGMWAGNGVTTPRVHGYQVAKARAAIEKATKGEE